MLHVKLAPFLPLPLLLLFLPLLTLDRSQHHALPAERVILNSRIGEVNQATGSRVAHLHDTLHLSIQWGQHTRRVPRGHRKHVRSAENLPRGNGHTAIRVVAHPRRRWRVALCLTLRLSERRRQLAGWIARITRGGTIGARAERRAERGRRAAARRAGRAVREYALRVTERLCRFGTRGVARTWALSVPYRIESVYDLNCIEKKASVSVGLALQNFSDDVMVRCAGGSMLAAVYGDKQNLLDAVFVRSCFEDRSSSLLCPQRRSGTALEARLRPWSADSNCRCGGVPRIRRTVHTERARSRRS